jgi:hypothetical protein
LSCAVHALAVAMASRAAKARFELGIVSSLFEGWAALLEEACHGMQRGPVAHAFCTFLNPDMHGEDT